MKVYFTLRETLINHYRTEGRTIAFIWKWHKTFPRNPLGYFPDEYLQRVPEDNWLPYNLKRLL
jgi:hypothetical protein